MRYTRAKFSYKGYTVKDCRGIKTIMIRKSLIRQSSTAPRFKEGWTGHPI
ncbi:hypothetical protein A73_157 [Escherichia phage A73]|uniref:Uncharacterized protein n=1 Tax=Escherichia phage A73 TaxID=3003819 RepID=A0AAE9VXH8_9CAUD|nr:hypothetical protein A73_157 [Escherichia phage A73]